MRVIKQRNNPILITGIHRSGTTWIGKMIAESPDVAYVSEPLNRWHRSGVFQANVKYWYTYIHDENEDDFLPAYKEIMMYKYHLWAEIKSIRSRKDFFRMWRDYYRMWHGRIRHARILFKDPFAIFSLPWFAQRLGCKIVIMIRHPAGFVSSLNRLGWGFDLNDLLSQSCLMKNILNPFKGEINFVLNSKSDIITQASLLWKIVYSVVLDYRKNFPEFYYLRHEDISRQPLDEFRKLFSYLDVDYSQQIRSNIIKSSASRNPKELSVNRVHAVRLDSKSNLENWKQRLSREEILRIYEITHNVADHYYKDEDWWS